MAALSVVTRDVPPYAIVAGNPVRIVRRRFSEREAARMQAIAWWDWDAAPITRHLPVISGGSVEALEAIAVGIRDGTASDGA